MNALRIEAAVCDAANARAERWKRRHDTAQREIARLRDLLDTKDAQ